MPVIIPETIKIAENQGIRTLSPQGKTQYYDKVILEILVCQINTPMVARVANAVRSVAIDTRSVEVSPDNMVYLTITII